MSATPEETIDGLPVIDVNERGLDPDGWAYDISATAEFVTGGIAINQDVLLRFPDGKLVHATRVMFTAAGMRWLHENVPLDMREPTHTTVQ